MDVVIVGGGISGLTAALELHARGIGARVYESTPELREVGVGISLLPHGARELDALGLLDPIRARAVPYREACFFNSFGQLIYRDPANPQWPQFLVHRADLHDVLLAAVQERLGGDAVVLGHTCVGVDQDAAGATARFIGARDGSSLDPQRGDVVLACDGIRSAIRKQLYPDEGEPVFSGVNMWRGVTRHPAILSGGSHARIGKVDTGKLVVYPIRDAVDEEDNQLMNWVAEVRDARGVPVDWNRGGRLEDFLPVYAEWRFDWLDVPDLLSRAEVIYEFPMSDREPVDRWAFGRVALIGDAAHPMIPRGSNGAMQAIVDARVVADALAAEDTPEAALRTYEDARLQTVNTIVLTNRTTPPDFLIETVERRTGPQPFERIEDVITEDEIREIVDGYKALTGSSREALGAR
jgi:2-polyprenyl-6-methoxyphenol hydroxylase-like FAD-dependent oxidoreductase